MRKNDFIPLLAALAGSIGCAAADAPRARQLTFGPGNDTEAAWSPDGTTLAFQTDRNGDLDIARIPSAGGALAWVVRGAGESAYPAWTPDGAALVYAHGDPMGTAFATRDAQMGFNLRVLRDGETRVLTTGHVRDYVPSVSPDGKTVWFTTTRNSGENGASVASVPLSGGEPTLRIPQTTENTGGVQPSLSPDGTYLLWAGLQGLYGNWRICAARATRPDRPLLLTPGDMSAYAPRWSPCGRYVACTGYRGGDPGWGVYLVRVADGALRRLDTGPGNSKSPAWSPDGTRLVFENNRTGLYKLYTMAVPTDLFPPDLPSAAASAREPCRPVARLSADGTELLLAGGSVAGRARGASERVFDLPPDNGVDADAGTFFVEATVRLEKPPAAFDYIAVGSFAASDLGFQLFFDRRRRLTFATRDGLGQYRFVALADAPRPGDTFRVTGVREATGALSIYVDGRLRGRETDSNLPLGRLRRISVGGWNGSSLSSGHVLDFHCGTGFPLGIRPSPRVFADL